MANLPVDHRDVHWNFMEGHFFCAASWRESVWEDSRGSHHRRNCQQRHNDDRDHDKTGAVNRFYLTAEYRCAFLDQLRSLVQAKRP